MAAVRDLYEILGVARNASADDIRSAYRRLAREHHPDVNADPAAEERFKEVAAAYEILSDPDKRARYDAYGSAGPTAFPFGDVSDLFEAFFGAGTFGRRRPTRRTRTQHGEDVFAQTRLGFREAVFGVARQVEVGRMEPCDRCGGNGAEPGTAPRRCGTCGGSGQVQDVRRSIFGTVMTAHPCGTCEGTGEEIVSPCEQCQGRGRVAVQTSVPVDIPPGVSDGMELRISGAGHAGRAGGPAGDLYLSVHVEDDPVFERHGQDVFAVLEVSMAQAALGVDVEVDTLDGPERIHVDPGTASGTTLRLRGKGVPNLGRRGRGDLFLAIEVATPRDLSRDERRLLEEFAAGRDEPAGKRASTTATLRRPASRDG
ncbi:MAG TPA: molecular chaperone DnaJ [Actinomycetota bacterium]|jgi:molecular chaperone DnaJ